MHDHLFMTINEFMDACYKVLFPNLPWGKFISNPKYVHKIKDFDSSEQLPWRAWRAECLI